MYIWLKSRMTRKKQRHYKSKEKKREEEEKNNFCGCQTKDDREYQRNRFGIYFVQGKRGGESNRAANNNHMFIFSRSIWYQTNLMFFSSFSQKSTKENSNHVATEERERASTTYQPANDRTTDRTNERTKASRV